MKNRFDNNDAFLLLALKDGQEKAYDFIFRKYYKALCAQANAYLHDLDLAQSLTQDCFIKFWEKRSQADTIENLSSYLSFMVRNKCIDYIRKTPKFNDLSSQTFNGSDNLQSDTQLLSREFEAQLIQALSQLPNRCRRAFEYSRFENMTYPEIAKKMDISIKAVEGLISRSLKILRSELKDYLSVIIIL